MQVNGPLVVLGQDWYILHVNVDAWAKIQPKESQQAVLSLHHHIAEVKWRETAPEKQ